MYAETGLMFPYFHNFNQEVQQFDEICRSEKPNAQLDMQNIVDHTPLMPDYNLWADDGDLFKAPEPIVEEQQATPLDPISMIISCGEDPLSDVFYECKKDLLAKEGSKNQETPLSEALSIVIKNPSDKNTISDEKPIFEGPFPKSISSTCLSSLDHHAPSFLDFPAMDFGSVYGIRRAFSEGDIKTFGTDSNGNENTILVQSSKGRTHITSGFDSEDRRVKLSRYRNKKARRNFGPKIKYACRKALADSQPRIRGRFAKNEETETSKKR